MTHHTFDAAPDAARSDELASIIGPMLFGETPETQGATIAQLMALFIAGHPPNLREKNLVALTNCVRDMVPVFVEKLISNGLAPQDWRDGQVH